MGSDLNDGWADFAQRSAADVEYWKREANHYLGRLAKAEKEAAARIAELEAALSAATARAEAAEAEAARLREALEPFAQHANDYEPPEGDDKQRIWGDWLPTIGDLRKARAALGGDHG